MRTNDMESLFKIFNHPLVYDMISDDSSVPPYRPDPNHFFVMNEDKTGAIRIDPVNGITCEVHIACMPEMWGRATGFIKGAIAWGFENTPYSKIITYIPEYNRAAIALTKRCGFKEEGRLTKSFLKRWEFHDQILFGLSKYD
jgi:hypothetical protein